jgi:hypothetical protein
MRRIALLIALMLPACAALPHAARHDDASLVVGRVLIYRAGKPEALTRSGSSFDSMLHGGAALTSVTLHNLDSGERFEVPIADEHGWFRTELPAGAYAVGVAHYIWVFDTPARFQAPPPGGRCYLGTLGIDLFAHGSVSGDLARVSGGAVPQADNDFQILDQSGAAQRWAGQTLASCPLQLAARVPRHRSDALGRRDQRGQDLAD